MNASAASAGGIALVALWRPARNSVTSFLRGAAPAMVQSFLSDGVRIAFIDVAPEAPDRREPIVLIHGFASNHRINWVNPRWVETLSKAGRRVVAFDNRGHGASEKLYDPEAYRSEIMARDAANLIDHLRIERADVMGYSMGARIASFLALARSRARAHADPRRPRRSSRQGRRPAARHRRGDGGAVAGRSERSDAAHVPRLRRADQERPRGARRLHPRLAPDP